MLSPRVGMCRGCTQLCYELIHGRTTCQPVLTTFLQPRHLPTRGDNITQSSSPDVGHMIVRNMLSNQQKRNKEYKSDIQFQLCYEPIHGRTTCQPVLTTLLQPRHIPTRDYNNTQSSAPDDGHMVVRNMLSNQQKINKEYKSDIQLVFLIHTQTQVSSEMSVTVYQQTRILLCVTEHRKFQELRYENVNSRIILRRCCC